MMTPEPSPLPAKLPPLPPYSGQIPQAPCVSGLPIRRPYPPAISFNSFPTNAEPLKWTLIISHLMASRFSQDKDPNS